MDFDQDDLQAASDYCSALAAGMTAHQQAVYHAKRHGISLTNAQLDQACARYATSMDDMSVIISRVVS